MFKFYFSLLLLLAYGCSKSTPVSLEQQLPSNPCTILVVRHGETEWNADGKGQGWNDIPLNDYGRGQAKEMAEEFELLPIKTIYTSSLSRAVETAQIIAKSHEATIIPDPAIRFYRQDKGKSFWPITEKGKADAIEKEIIRDATAYLKNVAKDHPGETVIFVTHRRVVGAIQASLGDKNSKPKRLANGKMVCVKATPYSLAIQNYEMRLGP